MLTEEWFDAAAADERSGLVRTYRGQLQGTTVRVRRLMTWWDEHGGDLPSSEVGAFADECRLLQGVAGAPGVERLLGFAADRDARMAWTAVPAAAWDLKQLLAAGRRLSSREAARLGSFLLAGAMTLLRVGLPPVIVPRGVFLDDATGAAWLGDVIGFPDPSGPRPLRVDDLLFVPPQLEPVLPTGLRAQRADVLVVHPDEPAVVYGLGAVLHLAAGGHPAPDTTSAVAAMQAAEAGWVDIGTLPDDVHRELRWLIRACTSTDRDARPPVDLVARTLAHLAT